MFPTFRGRSGVRASVLLFWVTFVFTTPVAHAQFRLPKVRLPDIRIPRTGDLNIPGLDGILKQDPALSTSFTDAVGEASFLDGFEPQNPRSLTTLKRGSGGGWALRPGAYRAELESYCLRAGTYGPSGGQGYLMAGIKGARADAIRRILRASPDHPEVSQQDIQVLLWAIIARAKISDMSPEMQRTARALLSEEAIFQLNGGALGLLPDNVRNQLLGKVSPVLRQVLEAENRLRALMARADTPFAQLERVAVLAGDPPPDPDSKRVPAQRWSYHPDGYFVRNAPSSYSRTRVEVMVPVPIALKRDARGRIIVLADGTGNRLDIAYNDALAPRSGDGSLRAHAFSSIRFIGPDGFGRKAAVRRTWNDTGWTFVGTAENERGAGAPGYAGWSERLRSAVALQRQIAEFQRGFDDRKRKIKWGDARDVTDLAHLKQALEAALAAPAGAPSNDAWRMRPGQVAASAWLSSLVRWAGGRQPALKPAVLEDSAVAPLLGAETAAGEEGGPVLPPPWPASGSGDEEEADWPEYDPSGEVAVPGETGRQRIGITIRPIPGAEPPAPTETCDNPPSSRPCCLLGFSVVDPSELGTHIYGDGTSGIVYTARAGFIDLGHLRDLCDLTKCVYDQIAAGNGALGTVIRTTHGVARLTAMVPRNLWIKVARAIAYDDSVGYEISTYSVMRAGAHNSSFSPEDLCSNYLGTLVAERAINAGSDFDTAVTQQLNTLLTELGAQTRAQTEAAYSLIKGRWVKRTSLPLALAAFDEKYLQRRNFSKKPWQAGHPSDQDIPAWVTADFGAPDGYYLYTDTQGMTQAQFWEKIMSICADAAKTYGQNCDPKDFEKEYKR